MPSGFSFADHVSLLGWWLDRRRQIVERIEGQLLNVRGKALGTTRDRRQFARVLDACVFETPGMPGPLAALKGQLEARHSADGFEPTRLDQFANELDPLELVVRAYEHWNATRWPGASGRLSYAQCLFAVFMLRQLERVSLRIWDDGREGAGDRLAIVQGLLDRLNTPGSATVFLRDASWLVQTAQGPLTPHLEPYLRTAEHISQSFARGQRIALHQAGAKLTAGHLRSQLCYGVWRTGKTIDHPDVLAFTRNSNALDNAVLLRDLLPLLEAYKAACAGSDDGVRLALADAILQGLSADADLFVARLDLLEAYTSIETIFVERDEAGRPRYSADGRAHGEILQRYAALITEMAPSLRADTAAFDPSGQAYSPFGIVYGFCADMLANMAMDALVGQPSFGLGLEDMFAPGINLGDKAARASGWRRLPKREGERDHFEHSAEFAGQVYERLLGAIEGRVACGPRPNASSYRDGYLWVSAEGASAPIVVPSDAVPAHEYCLTTDSAHAAATGVTLALEGRMLGERKEGSFLASAETEDGWFGVSKFVLTFVIGQGNDAVLPVLPREVAEVMALTCGDLVQHPKTKYGESS